MKTTVVVLDRFRAEGEKVATFLDAELVPYSDHVFADLYGNAEVIVAVMSAGIAVRGCAPHLSDKWHDPAVVVVTPDLRYAGGSGARRSSRGKCLRPEPCGAWY